MMLIFLAHMAMFLNTPVTKMGIVADSCNPITCDAEAGRVA